MQSRISYFYRVVFTVSCADDAKSAFADELFWRLEKNGFLVGGVQDSKTLEFAVDVDLDRTPGTDLSGEIEELLQSLADEHACVDKWRQRDESELLDWDLERGTQLISALEAEDYEAAKQVMFGPDIDTNRTNPADTQ